MSRFILLAFACALLNACASSSPVTGPAPDAAAVPDTNSTATAVEIPERAFPEDSVYPLLLAEFALRRREYNVALREYTALAPALRDPGISAHTTHLSQYLQRDQEALAAAQLWVELAPEDIESNSTLAALLVREGSTVEALPLLARVERAGKSPRFPALLNGFQHLDEQQRAELVKGINDLAQEFPQNTELMLTLALLHTELQQYQLALDKLDQLFELEPAQPTALILEAEILVNQKAKKPFARIQRALKDDPENQPLRLKYARVLTAVDIEAAREQFEILSAQSPRDGDLLFSLALINREMDDPLAAKAYLRQVLALQQRVDEANYYLGRIAEDRGDTPEAIAFYKEVGNSREFLPANSRMGQLLLEQGQTAEVQAVFAEQRQNFPELSEQLYGLEADLLVQSGLPEAAIQALNQGLAARPDSTALLYTRAMLYEQVDQLPAMERDLRAIIAADPNNTTALNALGYTLANRTQRYDEALQLISRALELQPNEPAILDSMGWVLYRTGNYGEAIEYLTRAYADFPDGEVAAHLGEVLWAAGKTDAAMTIWQGAVLRDPGHAVLLSTLERLGVELTGDTAAHEPRAGTPP